MGANAFISEQDINMVKNVADVTAWSERYRYTITIQFIMLLTIQYCVDICIVVIILVRKN
jgi:hypothetical protein